MIDLSNAPVDFIDFRTMAPPGLTFSESVRDPVVFLFRDENRYFIRTGSVIKKFGVDSWIFSRGIDFNWIDSGAYIYPLPRDISGFIRSKLDGFDPGDIPFSLVVEFLRGENNEFKVCADDSLWTSAVVDASKSLSHFFVPDLAGTLFQYQAQGVYWMRDRLARTGGVVLADEMGLGKTVQIISLLLLDRPSFDSPALIVCPTTLRINWVREIKKFAPNLSVQVHRGPNRARLYRRLQSSHVVLATYDMVVNDHVLFKAIDWSYLILDEAQAIKNPSSQRRVAVSNLRRARTIPVTGTPVENHLMDLWSLLDVAIPGILKSQAWFDRNFPDGESAARDLSRLSAPFVLRRQLRDVAQDLPERIDVDVPVEMDEKCAVGYNSVVDRILSKYTVAGPMVLTGQLQLFCAHPWLQMEDFPRLDWEDRIRVARNSVFPLLTPKVERALELIFEAFANSRKVLLFANFNQCNALLKEAAGGVAGVFWAQINGATDSDERQQIVDDFSSYDGPAILVLNPRAAGAGLNITAATVVIHYTQVWNPALEQQASARAHRRGQSAPVTIYHMYYVDTVEVVMRERAAFRRKMGADAVLVTSDDEADSYACNKFEAVNLCPFAVFLRFLLQTTSVVPDLTNVV